MAKKITMSLDPSSIGKAILELQTYQAGLKAKADKLRELIAERIAWRAQSGFNTAVADDIFVGGSPVYANVTVTISTSGDVTVVMADGDDAVFIEFGAGVFYNGAVGSSPHPWGNDNGFLIGEYGKGQGKRNVWALPGSTNLNPVLTHGTPAAMPMYHGVQDAIAVIQSLARTVFGN